MAIRTMRLPLLCATLMLGCSQAEQYADTSAADREAIDQVRAQEVAAINSGDLDLAYVTDDFVAMPPGEPAVMGQAGLRAWMEEFMSQFTASLSYPSTDVMIAGDMAVEHFEAILTITPADGGDPVNETLKGIHVYQRQADGSWKMTHDVWNTDSAPPME